MNTTAKMEILFFHQKQNDAKKKGEKTPHTGIKIFRSQVVLIRMKCIMVLIIINIYLQTTRRKKRTQQTKPTRNCYDTHTHTSLMLGDNVHRHNNPGCLVREI